MTVLFDEDEPPRDGKGITRKAPENTNQSNNDSPRDGKYRYRMSDGRYLTSGEIIAENEKKRETEAVTKHEREAKEAQEQAELDRAFQAEAKAIEDATYRTWTSANAKFTTEATLLSYGNGIITIQTRENKKIKVPLEKLTIADQEFVNNWRRQQH